MAKSFQILEIIVDGGIPSGETTHRLNPRTGHYASTNPDSLEDELHLLDCLGDVVFVNKIECKRSTQHNKKVISLDQTLDNGTVIDIKFIKCKPFVTIQPTDRRRRAEDMPLEEACTHIIVPVVSQSTSTTTTTTNTNTMLDTLQRIIISPYTRPIRLERTLRVRKETLAVFINKFFTEWNGNNEIDEEQGEYKNTIYVDNHEIQTDWGRRRSLGDIFMICRYYYPNCTLREVLTVLTTIVGNPHYRSSWCNTIRKKVWYYDTNAENGVFNTEKQDEYGYTYTQYLQALRS